MRVKKTDSTLRTSQAVPHPSTIPALSCLTSEVRSPVHSTWYGRQRRIRQIIICLLRKFFFGRETENTVSLSYQCQPLKDSVLLVDE